LKNNPLASYARAALEVIGVYPDEHRARQVDEARIREADLVLGMTPQHATALRQLCAAPPTKVRTLLGHATGTIDAEGISDPYGQSIVAYRASARRIFECLNLLIARL
jgi:protein-tyrosine-phosphatase